MKVEAEEQMTIAQRFKVAWERRRLVAMPLGFDVRPESEATLPEGDTRIAQRFNVGIRVKESKSPEGTADRMAPGSKTRTQPSLRDFSRFDLDPNVETLGYFRIIPSGMKGNPSGIGRDASAPNRSAFSFLLCYLG